MVAARMTRADRIKALLIRELQPSRLELLDESGRHIGHAGARPEGETHFALIIASHKLSGLSRVEQHRMIYDLLASELKSGLHAITIKTEIT